MPRPTAFFATLAVATLYALGPAQAQSNAKRANDLVDRLKAKELTHGRQQQTYAELLALGRQGRQALATRWSELSPSQIDWTLTVLARLDPALAVGPLAEASRSSDLVIRRSASAALLDLIDTNPDAVLSVSRGLLQDSDDAVTINAALALSKLDVQEVWQPLLDLLVSELTRDQSFQTRRPTLIRQLVQILAEILEQHGDHTLLVSFFDRAAQVKLASDEAVAAGEPALPYTRMFEVLGHRPIKLTLPYLRQILDECYRSKIEALTPTTEEAEDQDPFALPDPNLILALEQVFGEAGQGGIAADLRPWHPDIRLIAVGTVAQLRDTSSLPFVLQGLSDADPRVRTRALDVLGWVLPKDESARLATYQAVIPLLVDSSKRLRQQAHRWLQSFSGDKTVPQSYNAWTEWLEHAQQRARVRTYLLHLARDEGFMSIEELLAAHLAASTEEYLQSLGYESEAEFLADMREAEAGNDHADE